MPRLFLNCASKSYAVHIAQFADGLPPADGMCCSASSAGLYETRLRDRCGGSDVFVEDKGSGGSSEARVAESTRIPLHLKGALCMRGC